MALLVLAAMNESGALAWPGAVLLLGSAIWAAVKAPIVAAAKIEKDLVWVKGGGQPFLATLPEWNG